MIQSKEQTPKLIYLCRAGHEFNTREELEEHLRGLGIKFIRVEKDAKK